MFFFNEHIYKVAQQSYSVSTRHHSKLICFPTMSACGSSSMIHVFMVLLWQLKALGLAKERAQTKSKNLTKATIFHQPSVFVV